jgi:hypothetical protein
MAITSYTNVAKDELQRKVREGGRARRLLSAPHFVGTIDAFVNQYIFLPFGARYMDYTGGRPRLVGEPHSIWRSRGLVPNNLDNAYNPMFFDCYTVGADGKPIVLMTPRRRVGGKEIPTPTTDPTKMLGLKQHVWRLGYALQADANYIAYALLSSSERLSKALVGRFPVLVVDEAQDMTEVQHALIDHLRSAGLANIVLIGDEFQAIYEWNTARPQLFVTKSSDAAWNPKTISDTFRCSPAICTMLTNISGGQPILRAAPSGKNVAYREPVVIASYADTTAREDILAAVNDVASRLSGTRAHDDNAENVKTVAVVARSREHAAQLQAYFSGAPARPAVQVAWGNHLTKDYLRVVHHLHRGDRYGAATAYERLLLNHRGIASKSSLRTALAQEWNLDTYEIFSYRLALFEDLAKIESTLLTLDVSSIAGCAGASNVQLKGIRAFDRNAIASDCRSFGEAAKRSQDRPLASLFDSHEDRVFHQHRACNQICVTNLRETKLIPISDRVSERL